MSIVDIQRVSKRRGDDVVVRSVDLRIADGEFLVLVGPSGCGKTTVLRMVAGLDEISQGQILVDGIPIENVRRGQHALAMMFQDPALYPHMTVAENLGYPLKMAGEHRRAIRRHVEDMADLLGITPLLARRPRTLSGGQRQRVAMGRALIRHPDLLLMDEPMSNVDAKLRGELRATIGHLHEQFGITTLYVTHDHVEAMSLADRIAVMRHGEIVQTGTPVEIYDRPIDAFVATFIGSPAMNLFVATLRSSDGQPKLELAAGTIPLGPEWRQWMPNRPDRDVVVGVRPQAIHFNDEGLQVDVEHVDARAGRCEVTASMNAAPVGVTDLGVTVGSGPTLLTVDVPLNEDVELAMWRPSHVVLDACDVHLFDLETGHSLRGDLDRVAASSCYDDG